MWRGREMKLIPNDSATAGARGLSEKSGLRRWVAPLWMLVNAFRGLMLGWLCSLWSDYRNISTTKMREQSCHVFVLRSQIIPAAIPRRTGVTNILTKGTSPIWQRPPKCWSLMRHMLWSSGLRFLVSIQGHARGGRGREGCEGSGGWRGRGGWRGSGKGGWRGSGGWRGRGGWRGSASSESGCWGSYSVVGLHGLCPSTGASKRLCGLRCFLVVHLV